MKNLIYLKKGEIKTGFFSKRIACEFKFYEDGIIARPYGWNRLFNSADITILKKDIRAIKDGIRVIGYNIIIETNSHSYTCGFLGDKLMVKQLLEKYLPE
jgi:hypothetical protein